MEHCIVNVALDTPLDITFDYRCIGDNTLPPPIIGQLVLVPFGHRKVFGIVVGVQNDSEVAEDKLKDVIAIRRQLPPLSPQWLALCRFAADYYQRPLGEVALPGLPKNLRAESSVSLDRAIKKQAALSAVHDGRPVDMPVLRPAQRAAAEAIANAQGFAPMLLYGVTGSGKTEVYLQAAADILARAAADGVTAQILILVPEINLTPQLEGNVRARFPASPWSACIAAWPKVSAHCIGWPRISATRALCSAPGWRSWRRCRI